MSPIRIGIWPGWRSQRAVICRRTAFSSIFGLVSAKARGVPSIANRASGLWRANSTISASIALDGEQALADRDATLAQARDSGWRVADLSRLTGLSVQVIDAAIKRARS